MTTGGARVRFLDRRLSIGRWSIPLVVVIVVVYLGLSPTLYLVWRTFNGEAGLSLDVFTRAFSHPNFDLTLLYTAEFTLGVVIFSLVLGTTLAYLVVRTDVPAKGLVYASAVVPLIIPGVLYAISWIFLASPRTGTLNAWFDAVVGQRPFDVFGMGGMIWVQGLHYTPLVFLLMAAAFRSFDPSLEESAQLSGANRRQVLRTVTLPLLRPALYSVLMLMAIQALGDFETPALLGVRGGRRVLTYEIFNEMRSIPPGFDVAGAFSLVLLAFTGLGLFFYSRMSRNSARFQTITGKAFKPRLVRLGQWRWAATGAVVVYFVVAVVLPILILLYAGTQDFYLPPTLERIGNANLDQFREVFSNGVLARAAKNSVVLSVATATISMVLVAVIAWLVVRTKLRGRWMLDTVVSLPLTVPGIVIGVSFIFIYLRAPLPIYGTLWILLLAYVTRTLPYGMRYVSGAMYQVSQELEDAAHVSGASWLTTFRTVVLPLLAPALLAGWMFIVMLSLRELSASILLYSPGTEVLSVAIWELWESGQLPELAALGVLFVAGLFVLVLVAQRLGRQFGIRGY